MAKLDEYKRKRKFGETPEPPPKEGDGPGGWRFVVQKHHATRLHYDFRLELEGVLKSWAVPKGPTLDPGEKRLSMMTEDHPLDYMEFEGIIPAGNYGAGTVMVWDLGTFAPARGTDPLEGLQKGDLKFTLDGQKLKGEFAMVRIGGRRPGSRGNEWLLIKKKDEHAHAGWDAAEFDWSATTGRSLEQIAADEGSATWESSKKKERKPRIGTPDGDAKERAKAAAARRTLDMVRKEAAERAAAGQPEGPEPEAVDGAVKREMPAQIDPMLATLVDEAPRGDEWLFEIKWDGVRAIAFLDQGNLRFQSRSGRDVTACYPDLNGIVQDVRARRAILDGEIVVIDNEGRSSFGLLQQRMNVVPDAALMRHYPVIYYVFDLLYLDGYDLRGVPLERRKEMLRSILPAAPTGRIRFSDHQPGQGRELAELAAQRGLEGVVGKLATSHYTGRRSRDWQKIKTTQETVAIVGGYTEPRGSRQYFGSLVLGEQHGSSLIHIGNAGTGFNHQSQKEMWEKLKPLLSDNNPFEGPVPTPEPAHYVRPELRARVKFTEWTRDRKLRAPVFLGLESGDRSDQDRDEPGSGPHSDETNEAERRTDETDGNRAVRPKKPARERPQRSQSVKLTRPRTPPPPAGEIRPYAHSEETPFSGNSATQTVSVNGRTMAFQNLNKVFFPEDGLTKRHVMEYYYRIAPTLLPHMEDKPVTLKRYPDGIHGMFFFQKEAGEAMPKWIRTVELFSEYGHTETINYVICNDRATLVYLANLGCIDQNLTMSRYQSIENPDFVLFDLDPGDDAPFDMVVEVAQALKSTLDELGVAAYPKTSGATGMHVCLPLEPIYTYDVSRNFAELVYSLTIAKVRALITTERTVRRRPQNRVYLDALQNALQKTIPPPYSLRPHPGAAVSTPLQWSELERGLDPKAFNVHTIWARLERHSDLYAGMLNNRQRLEGAIDRLQGKL